MPTHRSQTVPPEGRAAAVAGVTVLVLLSAVSLGLVLQGGAYDPSTWLPLMAAVAALALPLAVAGPAVSSHRWQKVLLIVFGLQALWTLTSALWAGSLADVWQETNRTLFYAVTIGLTFSAVRWARAAALRALAVLVTGLAGIVAVVILVALSVNADPSTLFLSGRLNYPVTYPNGLPALLVVGFWLALGMSSGVRCTPSGERLPLWTQPLLLSLAVVLVETALLPQSRGAMWTFVLTAPLFVLLSPNRFRALVNMATVLVPVVVFWGRLNAPYLALTSETPLDPALGSGLLAVAYSVVMVVALCVVTGLIERWVGPLRRRVVIWIGAALITLAALGIAAGITYADVRTGGLGDYLGDRWQEATAVEYPKTQGATRFEGLAGFGKRVKVWQVAGDAFVEHPVLGLGAQNFESYWYQHRPMDFGVKQPHGHLLQLLAELGLPGALLWLVFIIGTLVYAVRVRFRQKRLADQTVLAAMITAVLSWSIHSSGEWLWQLAGVTLPVMMLLGGLVAAGEGPESRPEPIVRTADGVPQHVVLPSRRRRFGRSALVRGVIVVIALGALVSAGLPYLSLRYSALAAGAPDIDQATSRAHMAATLDPTSLEPFIARAGVHMSAASAAPNVSERLTQLRLAADAWEEELEVEPQNWAGHLNAARVLLQARDAAEILGSPIAQELADQARMHLAEARRLNPLSPEIEALEASGEAL